MRPGGSWRGKSAGQAIHPHGVPCNSSDLVMGLASPGAFPCPERSPAYNVQFSKRAGDGHLLAFGTEFGQLVILDTRANAVVLRDHNGPVGWGQTERSTSSSIRETTNCSSMRQRVGNPSVGGMGFCRSWGVRQPTVVAQYRALINCIFDVEWTHDDRQMALACGDARIRVHDTETSIEVLMLHGHGGSVKAISANPVDNSVLLSGSRDGSFALWDTRLQREKPDMEGLHRLVAPEDTALAMAPANRLETRYLTPVEQVHFANHLNAGQRKRPLSYVKGEETKIERGGARGGIGQSSVTAVEWMPDGQKFLSAGQDGLVKLWDTRYINQPLQAAGQPHGAPTRCRTPPSPLSPTNSNACSSSTPCSSPSPSPSTPRSSPFSQDRLGSGSASRRSSSGGLHRGKAARGRRRAALPFGRVTGGDSVAEETLCQGGRACGVSSVHACDDGSKIAVCTVKNHVSVYAYSCGSLRALGAFTGNENRSSYYIKAKLSPDGSLLASGATDDALCLWNVDCPGPPVARLTGHLNEVTGVDWCRAEPLKLATSSDDETIRLWTLDPLRVAKHPSAARRTPLTPSSSPGVPRPPDAAEGLGSGMVGTVPGWTPGLPRPPAGAALGGSSRDSGGGGGGGGGGYDPRSDFGGKFRVGTAIAGESSWWRGRGLGRDARSVYARGDTGYDARDDVDPLPPNRRRRRRVQGPLQAGSGRPDRGGVDDMMDVSPSPPPTTPLPPPLETPHTPLVPPRTRSPVCSPHSASHKAGATRPRFSAAHEGEEVAAGADSGGDGGGSALAEQRGRWDPAGEREAQTRDDENAAPAWQQKEPYFSAWWTSRSREPQALDGDLGVIVVDAPAAPSEKSGGFLDGLPRGWSTAARAGKSARPSVGGQQQQQQQQQQGKQQETRKTVKLKNCALRQKGVKQGSGGGAIPRGRESHTLFAFWTRGQGGVNGDGDAQEGAPARKEQGSSQLAT